MSVEYQLNNGNLHLKTVFVKVGTTQLSSPLWSPLVTTLCCARALAAWAGVLTSVGVFCSSSCPQSEDLQQQQRTTAHNSTTAPQHVISSSEMPAHSEQQQRYFHWFCSASQVAALGENRRILHPSSIWWHSTLVTAFKHQCLRACQKWQQLSFRYIYIKCVIDIEHFD